MHIESLSIYILLFCEVYTLNVVISFSGWISNSKFFGVHKSPASPKIPQNISPTE